jgi:histidine triad (HIT) family protein
MPDSSCIFCKIIKGEIPSKKAFENDRVLAFYDSTPKAPKHILVIPKEHHASIQEIPQDRWSILSDVFSAVKKIIAQENLGDTGYRLVVNSGQDGGQAVPHLHVHILGGRRLTWPPG